MAHRVFSVLMLALALGVLLGAPVVADDKADKNVHLGKFVNASGTEFTMTTKADNKEHRHMLAADGKVIGPDGRDCKLADLKPGQMIRVTTKEGDFRTATRVEAVKEK